MLNRFRSGFHYSRFDWRYHRWKSSNNLEIVEEWVNKMYLKIKCYSLNITITLNNLLTSLKWVERNLKLNFITGRVPSPQKPEIRKNCQKFIMIRMVFGDDQVLISMVFDQQSSIFNLFHNFSNMLTKMVYLENF